MVGTISTEAVASFAELHQRLSDFGTGWIFRGHTNHEWELIPKAGRKRYLGTEKDLFEQWKRRAVEHRDSDFSDLDWLSIAQHHGLATRLLDWTTNPLNAAFFAVREKMDGPAVVHAGPAVIHAAKFKEGFEQSAESLPAFKEPLEVVDGVAIFRPRGILPRIVRQGGLFTIHGPPNKSLEGFAQDGFVKMEKILIAESYRPDLLVELARYGISSASLFPDLDGLATYLNWKVGSSGLLD